MIVWLILLAVAATFARLLLRSSTEPWRLVVAALLFGFAGYGLTGHPDRPAYPAKPLPNDSRSFPELLDARQKLLPANSETGAWITFAEARARQGHSLDAVEALQDAIKRHPRDAALWTALGNALFLHAQARLTPAARLAYARAASLDPKNSAPAAFLALAKRISGTKRTITAPD